MEDFPPFLSPMAAAPPAALCAHDQSWAAPAAVTAALSSHGTIAGVSPCWEILGSI